MSETVSLESLAGLRMLDARGDFVCGKKSNWQDSDPHVVVLRLDGKLYWFQEDPSDGYRSSLDYVRIVEPSDLPSGALAEFPPRLVNCLLRTEPQDKYVTRDDVLYGIDEATGSVLFEIGTENLDDYYPSFVSSWMPPEVSP